MLIAGGQPRDRSTRQSRLEEQACYHRGMEDGEIRARMREWLTTLHVAMDTVRREQLVLAMWDTKRDASGTADSEPVTEPQANQPNQATDSEASHPSDVVDSATTVAVTSIAGCDSSTTRGITICNAMLTPPAV